MSTKSLEIADDGWSSLPAAGTALVFGAAGGIGSAIVRWLQTDRCFTKVITFSRRSMPAIDLLSGTSLQDAAALASVEGDIRLVVDATGFLHDETHYPEKTWRDLDPTKMARAFALNAIGPALIMKHVLPLLPRVGKSVFATLSARVGSIGDNRSGGWYSYRASKAALNQLVRTAAIELKRVRPEAICVALHPGTVDTRLSSPFRKANLDVQSPDVAAQRLLGVIEGLGPGHSGGFFDYREDAIPW